MTSDYSAEHKVPPFGIDELTNQTPGFYDLLGPVLSNREVVSELGAPIWDDPGKLWFVARAAGTGELLGVAGLRGREVCSVYVLPGARGQMVGYALVNAAVTRGGAQELRATTTEAGTGLFERHGFVESGTRGRFHRMIRG
jgi:GNAT superfamily N-acetyltransferase